MNDAQLKALLILLGFGTITFWIGFRMGVSNIREAYGDVIGYETLAYLALKDNGGE